MAAAGPSALWYLTRGTGAVSLVLLTLSVALGIANVLRVRMDGVPRFVFDAVHRNASLLAMAVLLVHIGTSVIDKFAPIRLVDAVVPFVSAYRPLWLGLGALGFDLMVAVLITSLVRRRLGHGAWRAIHWLAYACWPIALLHGVGTGSDTKATWMLALTAACLLAVLVSVWIRIRSGWPEHVALRRSAVFASTVGPLALLIWLPTGPLAPGWAKRAGTPASLLRAGAGQRTPVARRSASSRRSSPPRSAPAANLATASTSFSASATGSVGQTQLSNGLVQIQLRLGLSGQPLSSLFMELDGQPVGRGGVQMLSSAVDLGSKADPNVYTGRITALEGTNIQARVRGPRGPVDVLAQLQLDPGAGSAAGTVTVRPAGTGEGDGR